MATTEIRNGGHTLVCHVDMINTTCQFDTIDSRWKGTCENGHAVTFKSLERVVDHRTWCDGEDGWYHHDPHWLEDSHYECPECEARVVPGIIRGGTPQFIPGMKSFTLDGEPITEGVAIALLESWRQQ